MLARLALAGVEVSYSTPAGAVRALQGIDLSIEAGEMVCVFGASGSGKSTLLATAAGLQLADAGSVKVDGVELARLSEAQRTEVRLHKVGMVFQEHNLVSQFSARENVEIILRAQGCRNPAEVAVELLATVGIAELAERLPPEMSGGQRQRVGIARAFAGNRPVLLCDEPTGALDEANSRSLFTKIRDLAHDQKVACLVATHDPLAESFADRCIRLTDGVIQ